MLHPRCAALLSICLGIWGTAASLGEDTRFVCSGKPQPLSWLQDYGQAVVAAEQRQQMLLIYFHASQANAACEEFESTALAAPTLREKLKGFTLLRLPTSAEVDLGGNRGPLLSHPAFADMHCCPGVAIVDYAHQGAAYYGHVVSAFPLTASAPYSAEQLAVILDLPAGSLTQRTLIYAVRTHPDRPGSTRGQFDPTLAAEAESHSQYQAQIRSQGHHFWERRFHRINVCLPGGLTAKEVCAESWAGQGLLEAAIECVRCWRLSSGHWQAVSSPYRLYGYDMKLGDNGIWYATGILAGG